MFIWIDAMVIGMKAGKSFQSFQLLFYYLSWSAGQYKVDTDCGLELETKNTCKYIEPICRNSHVGWYAITTQPIHLLVAQLRP